MRKILIFSATLPMLLILINAYQLNSKKITHKYTYLSLYIQTSEYSFCRAWKEGDVLEEFKIMQEANDLKTKHPKAVVFEAYFKKVSDSLVAKSIVSNYSWDLRKKYVGIN